MLTFWGEVSLTCLAVYALGSWVISLVPSPKRTINQERQDHGLHGSNRERAINQSYNWR